MDAARLIMRDYGEQIHDLYDRHDELGLENFLKKFNPGAVVIIYDLLAKPSHAHIDTGREVLVNQISNKGSDSELRVTGSQDDIGNPKLPSSKHSSSDHDSTHNSKEPPILARRANSAPARLESSNELEKSDENLPIKAEQGDPDAVRPDNSSQEHVTEPNAVEQSLNTVDNKQQPPDVPKNIPENLGSQQENAQTTQSSGFLKSIGTRVSDMATRFAKILQRGIGHHPDGENNSDNSNELHLFGLNADTINLN
jgi:hypothetical protein